MPLDTTVADVTASLPTSDRKHSAIFLQEACLQHRFIRSQDISNIVERPQRLRAVTIGLSAAIARLEEVFSSNGAAAAPKPSTLDPHDLVEALGSMKIGSDLPSVVSIVQSQATVDILNNAGVKFIHGDIEKDVYLENLKAWTKESWDKIAKGESEIPEGLSQGDLYLCPESIDAIQGAIGTVCEAVDNVVASSRSEATDTSINRAFVAIRPPGHHCGEDTPSGFCFVNNVAVGAAHAHLQHGIKRIIILDIDLHHGNGTQSIVWQINEETYRQSLETESGALLPDKPGPQVYYGSIHDILSYPCEDGKPHLVQAASVSLHKSHGQYIENVHLQTYTSEEHFWDVLYKDQYSRLLRKAEEFLDGTGGPGDDVMVFISCGMDACEHEYESMSRHNRKVPTSFYYRFARDTCTFSDKYANGRVVSVLEGGYSDRALTSGAMAHLSGLVDVPSPGKVNEQWWAVDNLVKLEKATKKRRGGRPSLPAAGSIEPWVERTLAILLPLDAVSSPSTRSSTPIPPSSRTLRDRTKGNSASPGPPPTSARRPVSTAGRGKPTSSKPIVTLKVPPVVAPPPPAYSDSSSNPSSTDEEVDIETPVAKKLPRVILKLGKPPETS
ncbi:histone deacetylase domain-containing protein [Crucibulum laeve]|uniref:Histone deacetylase domain-containing protein n=1 Tax=Crucibulum laeve TaxID=68775 RepID=A0A5C3LQC8_9AGAR|nr:histone deacetylase domain-containing protein [Crucibulum laeve]